MSNQKNTELELKEDPRYKQCNREALWGLALGVANLVWWFAWGYGLGNKPPEEYTYILGFPSWFFMSCIAGAILFSLLAIAVVTFFFKDMPLEADEKYREQKEN
ncbi:MAG: YhdT family protein [Firmicutes bacterium]|nr:YhdT family protein [Bacillota bacterium]